MKIIKNKFRNYEKPCSYIVWFKQYLEMLNDFISIL